jgi:hypothetical protein
VNLVSTTVFRPMRVGFGFKKPDTLVDLNRMILKHVAAHPGVKPMDCAACKELDRRRTECVIRG